MTCSPLRLLLAEPAHVPDHHGDHGDEHDVIMRFAAAVQEEPPNIRSAITTVLLASALAG